MANIPTAACSSIRKEISTAQRQGAVRRDSARCLRSSLDALLGSRLIAKFRLRREGGVTFTGTFEGYFYEEFKTPVHPWPRSRLRSHHLQSGSVRPGTNLELFRRLQWRQRLGTLRIGDPGEGRKHLRANLRRKLRGLCERQRLPNGAHRRNPCNIQFWVT